MSDEATSLPTGQRPQTDESVPETNGARRDTTPREGTDELKVLDELSALRGRIDLAEGQRAELQRGLEAANQARGRLLDAVEDARQQNANLRATLDAELPKLRHDLAEANQDRVNLRSALEVANADQVALRRALEGARGASEAMRSSLSWRVTRPLRAVTGALRRLTRRRNSPAGS
jgi:chromosome segregation ATPase